ncbi:LOW QUALITY PROTEIN: transforming growth factor beta receptor type 3 [Brienomyrus brachyistius]|uniref:LOW QUALITY PROTEIN: transforming growth factor beta receptor type 3 n=1 Tax=Brienomyrus brachyistius TaxID=42636 RepID=UPI0020B37C7F|nr:LOW QUALITY PROTEIN: transforming growth factor beta receptor type 3 [Brienomyrus brachyistius]
MRSVWTQAALFCLLLLEARTAVCFTQVQCSVSPVGSLHPVQGLLEQFGAGPGCAARESGDKETHVISVGGASVVQPNQVTVLLRPLSFSHPPVRPVTLVLSSQHAVSWWLEGERLPTNLVVIVQMSAFSDVQTRGMAVQVRQVPSLPWRPRPLHRWVLKNHSSLSSLNHAEHANRVYLRLGEDPTMPSVCQLQSLFLSHSYLTSDLQLQPIRGCLPPGGGASREVEVHVISLQSAGSGMCGSLQVEVPISVLPPVGNVSWYELVLVLSSATPVNWALTAIGLQGHISVYSSNTVSPLYPSEPGLTMTSTVIPNLYKTRDLLAWANQHGLPAVTSYTEADLANRFTIKLAGGRAEYIPTMQSQFTWVEGAPQWGQERRLRQWLSQQGEPGTVDGVASESVSTQCQDGLLEVAVNTNALQPPFPVLAVTLSDRRCKARFNGSHFLLVFPVIFCGTEAVMEKQPKAVWYKNTVLLWRDSSVDAEHNRTGEDRTPLIIYVRRACRGSAELPMVNVISLLVNCQVVTPTNQGTAPPPHQASPRGLWAQQEARSEDSSGRHPALTPILSMRLSVTEGFERKMTGPYIIMANSRVHVEVSVRGFLRGSVEVKSCVVSPLSHPEAAPSWMVIQGGCSFDPMVRLSGEGEHQGYGGGWRQDTATGNGGNREGGGDARSRGKRRRRGGPGHGKKEGRRSDECVLELRFSFILHPIYNNPIQFLHCQLHQCDEEAAPTAPSPTRETAEADCAEGIRVPALVAQPNRGKCHYRTLSRPVVVTQPVGARQTLPPVVQSVLRPRMTTKSKSSAADLGNGIDTAPVVGIVFAAFLMGIGLMGALWCIHSHTGMSPAFRRGSLLDSTPQPTAGSRPALMEHSSSSV